MKKFLRMSCFTIVIIMLCSMATQFVSADDYSYDVVGGKFSQGIENVTCKNNVPGSEFPELYVAVESAIVDWDWHLAILNERNNVNWNMTSVSTTNAMIEFYAMSNSQAEAFLTDYMGYPVYIDDQSVMSITTLWNGDTPCVYPQNWNNSKIILLYENMQEDGIIDEYYRLQIYINHEIGHALGLNDYPYDDGVIMYPDPSKCTSDVPTAADLNGIYEIYG